MNITASENNRIWTYIFFAILLVGVLLQVWTIGNKAPWQDEIHSLVYARNSIAHLTDTSRTTDIHPPLYFLSLKGWVAIFGESREAGRLFSITLSTLCICLVFAIARRLFDVPTALVAMGFFATFPTAVHYGREIRMYPLLTFLFLVSFVFFLAMYRSGQDRSDTAPRARALLPMAGFSISLALTFYTHYTASILFMLYTLVGLYCLIRGEKAAFFWTFLGLAVATILTLPQLNHLFSSSLGDPDKSWMQATTFPIFYNISLGAYSYPAVLKLPVLMVLVAGFGVLWMRDKTIAGILFLFTAGGMLLAAAIGVVEPIYLVRTIQIYTVFAGILVALALLRLPRSSAILLGAGLLAANIYTVVQDQYLPERVPLLADRTAGFVDLLDPSRDQVFAKNYLQSEMELMRVPLFEGAEMIRHVDLDAGIAAIKAQEARCLAPAANAACRSVVMIIEKESLFDVEAIAAWNALADELKAAHPQHVEYQIAGYRVVVLSNDPAFLAQVEAAL